VLPELMQTGPKKKMKKSDSFVVEPRYQNDSFVVEPRNRTECFIHCGAKISY
jgi:hypothetical protein